MAQPIVPFPPKVERGRSRRPARRLSLPRRRSLRDGVIGAFVRVLRFASSQARRAAIDPVVAVHEFRKSTRRARAVVDLISPALGRRASAAIDRRLREAFRRTGPLRDADILMQTLRSLPEGAPGRARGEEILQGDAAAQAEGPRAADTLRDGAEEMRALAP